MLPHSWRKTILLLSKLTLGLSGIRVLASPGLTGNHIHLNGETGPCSTLYVKGSTKRPNWPSCSRKKNRLDFLHSAYITDDTLNQNYRRALPMRTLTSPTSALAHILFSNARSQRPVMTRFERQLRRATDQLRSKELNFASEFLEEQCLESTSTKNQLHIR